ncbi:MAG: hypothetical protein KIT33_14190 [Candidatus Kapabacteria bacterium]|nr:hypothetical protein [Ignavibacteriota bacterium]MCW5886117.1 hypothetical protein [Candidatus Kapabacteria bacterium]
MKYQPAILIILFLLSNFAISQEIIKIERSADDKSGVVYQSDYQLTATPIDLPDLKVIPKVLKPLILPQSSSFFKESDEKIIESVDFKQYLNPTTYLAVEIDPVNKNLKYIRTGTVLTEESESAILQSPKWIEDQLRLKLTELRSHGIQTEREYANLILKAEEKIKDEVAFVLANMSYQSLVDSRFIVDKEAIIRNAEYIYLFADSLQYVEIVEHGNFADRTFRTTTRYRIYDSAKRDTVWSEIPSDIYYWYVVHPKMDQEGVYVRDNNNNASGQRTYGYAWRDYIWNNPDALYDYRNVNKTTAKGSILTIPRFGELIQTTRYLWDRKKAYFPFNRPLNPENSALDLIGNWCSRALPVDVT